MESEHRGRAGSGGGRVQCRGKRLNKGPKVSKVFVCPRHLWKSCVAGLL